MGFRSTNGNAFQLEVDCEYVEGNVVMLQLTWLYTAILFSALAYPVCAVAQISEHAATESADMVMARYGVVPPLWTSYIDHDLDRWQYIKALWQKRSATEKQLGREDTDFGPWLLKMESALAGRRVWAVVYKLTLPAGERAFHQNAMAFIDADTGVVLALIEPEGYPRFPK